jgi:GTP-binding protein EngB required for normal cell division
MKSLIIFDFFTTKRLVDCPEFGYMTSDDPPRGQGKENGFSTMSFFFVNLLL